MKRYLVTSLVVSALLMLAYYPLNQLLFSGYLHEKYPILILFFFAQSFPVAWILRQGEKDLTTFHIYAIGSIGFRMITALFLLLFFFFQKTADIMQLSIQFTGIYLIYLIFELIVVLAKLRRN